MVRKLFGNFFSFVRAPIQDTKGFNKSPGPYPKRFFVEKFGDHMSPQSSIDFSPSQGSIMPTSGKFVGMIVHVEGNDLATVETTFVFSRINYPWETSTKIELGRVTIPGGTIGCFYSDPDTSDGERSYGQFAALLIEGFISADGSSALGTSGTTVLAAIDTNDEEIECPAGFTLGANNACFPDP